jgi:hypothetical protein
LLELYIEWFEQFCGEPSFLAKEAEKEMLRTDVAMVQAFRFFHPVL